MKKELKQLLYFNAFKDIIEIFGETECGCNELDIEKIANFVASDTFFFKTFNLANEEDILNYVTNKILDGFPIWEFLKLTSWQKDMLAKSFKQECEDEYNELKKTYKCFTCKYYHIENMSLGVIQKCNRPKDKRHNMFYRDTFELKKTCKYYEK